MLSYNARCEVSFLAEGADPAPGSALHALTQHRDTYLRLQW